MNKDAETRLGRVEGRLDGIERLLERVLGRLDEIQDNDLKHLHMIVGRSRGYVIAAMVTVPLVSAILVWALNR